MVAVHPGARRYTSTSAPPTGTTNKRFLTLMPKSQLGARDDTFLCASGDNGVGPSGICFTNDGKYTPTFLSSSHNTCPKSPTLNPNTVYLYESSGRAYPDIAAQFQQVATTCNDTDRGRRFDTCERRLDRGGQVTSGVPNSVAVL